jgi:hypothetical protein
MRAIRLLLASVMLFFVGRASASDAFRMIHVADLGAMLDAQRPGLFVYDVNPPSTRRTEGIIPGAKLLSSFDRYDVATELPPVKDAKLVFYCANTH